MPNKRIVFTHSEPGLNRGEYLYIQGQRGTHYRNNKGANNSQVQPDGSHTTYTIPSNHFKYVPTET